jgi:transposase
VDHRGRPLRFILTGGQTHDGTILPQLLDWPVPPLAILADKAYGSKANRQLIGDEGALAVIPSKSNAKEPIHHDADLYRQRHRVENFFCRLKDWRKLATRYDKLARNFLAATHIFSIRYWLNCESRA